MTNSTKEKHIVDIFDPRQFHNLNKEFYENNMLDYFDMKITLALNLLEKENLFLNEILGKELKIGDVIYTMDTTKDDNFIERYAKTEISMTTFHCLETFLRTFIAHSALSGCPWIEYSKIDQPKFGDYLRKLKSGNISVFDSELNNYQIIREVFWGGLDLPEEFLNELKTTKEDCAERYIKYIIYAAEYVSANREYNTYKHGLYYSLKESKFSIVNDSKIGFQVDGDALTYISRRRDKSGKFEWFRVVKWTDYILDATLSILYSDIIRNLLSLWEKKLVCEDKEFYVNIQTLFDLDEILTSQSSSVDMLNNDFLKISKKIEIAYPLLLVNGD